MKCPSCGKENTGDSRFCAFCGGKLTAENNANSAVQGFEKNYEKKPKKNKLPVIIAVIIAAVILLVAGFFVLKFTVLDAFAQESRVKGGLTDFFTVNDDIAELEKSFRTSHGYIKPADVNIVLDEVGDYAKEKLETGEIKDYAVTENESVWIQFTSGVEYIYVPKTEEIENTNDETKNEDGSQQGDSDEAENNSSQEAQSHQAALRIFDKQSEEITEEKLKEISEQYKLELTDSEELTLEMIEKIGKDKLVVWYGDGGYSEKTRALLPTSVRLDEERLQNDPEYLKELGYYEEYLSGGIVCTNGGYIAVTSKFFESRTETFDGSAFYLGSASSGKDDVLAKALLDKKASAVLANTEAICQDYNLNMINSVLSGMWRANSEKKYNSLSEALAKAKEENGDFCCDSHPDTEVKIFGNGAESFRFSEGEAEYTVSEGFGKMGYVVNKDGNTYYWKYSSDSFNNVGLLGGYSVNPSIGADLVCKDKNGKETMIYHCDTAQEFIVTDSKIFIEKADNSIISTDLRGGNNTEEITSGYMMAVSEDGKYIVFSSDTALLIYNTKDGTTEKATDNGSFAALHDDVIYYYVSDGSEDSRKGELTVFGASLDGNEARNLCTTKPDLYDFHADSPAFVCRMYFDSKYIYFSYGCFGGSAHLYQGGKIIRMEYDGSNAEVVGGKDKNVYYMFEVTENGEVIEEYNLDDTNYGNLKTNYEYKQSDIYISDPANGRQIKIADASEYSLDGTNELFSSIGYAELCGDKSYFLVHYGKESPKDSMGWRTAYTRVKSALFEKDLTNNNISVVYEF